MNARPRTTNDKRSRPPRRKGSKSEGTWARRRGNNRRRIRRSLPLRSGDASSMLAAAATGNMHPQGPLEESLLHGLAPQPAESNMVSRACVTCTDIPADANMHPTGGPAGSFRSVVPPFAYAASTFSLGPFSLMSSLDSVYGGGEIYIDRGWRHRVVGRCSSGA